MPYKIWDFEERLTSADINDSFEFVDSAIIEASSNANNLISGTVNNARLPVLEHSKMPSGSVLQVVTATDSTARSTFSAAFVDASISASITPRFATSNLLIEWTLTAESVSGQGGAGGEGGEFRLADSSNASISGGSGATIGDWGEVQYSSIRGQVTVRALVSAASTAARTYKGQFKTTGGYNTVISNDKMIGLLTIMEIAA